MVFQRVTAPGEEDVRAPLPDEERKQDGGRPQIPHREGARAVADEDVAHPLRIEPHATTETALRLSAAMVAP